MLFATLETHATTTWAAFQVQLRHDSHVLAGTQLSPATAIAVFLDMVSVLEDTSILWFQLRPLRLQMTQILIVLFMWPFVLV